MTLREHRKNARLTQAQLARKAGVQQATISMLENGVTQRPAYDLVKRIAEALGVTPDELFPAAPSAESAS